jgi:hypothetical protein
MAGPGQGSSVGVVRVRYGRLTAAASSLLVTLVALLGGVGLLPTGGSPAAAATQHRNGQQAKLATQDVPPETSASPDLTPPAPETRSASAASHDEETALPADSGSGRRVVFDISDQRVWLVDADDDVQRSYLVSGSLTDNLEPGSYAVYSRSRWATGVDDSGVMEYFVRFTHGDHAAIGFHSIPTKDGTPLQTRAQLGTPQSHGCIRQWKPDAKRLWDFAPVGTKVVVTA